MRDIVSAIFYVLRGGIRWRMMPPFFPPHLIVYGWFAAWRDAGVWQSIDHHLVMQVRERAGREASRSGGPRGYDAGKKVLGRKRHAMR
jgi:putative transposase